MKKSELVKLIKEEIVRSHQDKLFLNDIIDTLEKYFKVDFSSANGTLHITDKEDESKSLYLEYRY